MKKIQMLVMAVALVMGLSMCTQNKQAAQEDAVDSTAVMPQFPGGQDSLNAYFSENLIYPQKAIEVGMEGRVMVSFIVEKDGQISNVSVEESVDSLLDAEAVRVVSEMPAWTPGQNEQGEAVRVKNTVPITFLVPDITADVDKKPEFPGGKSALMEYLQKNIKYPENAERDQIEGRVLIRFIVAKDGSITSPEVVKPVNPDLDAEALRAVKAMPKWIPGENGGQAASVEYTLPVSFVLK